MNRFFRKDYKMYKEYRNKELSLREHQLWMLDILKDVHSFCIDNGIKYSLEGGTLLGAIRHKGFIPWDDDIDIIMPRDQYEAFILKYKSDRYDLVTVDTDPSYLFPYARVCDMKKTTYDALLPCSKVPTGIWIDIFPADGMPSVREEQVKFYETCRKQRNIIYGRIRSVLMNFRFDDFWAVKTLRYNIRLMLLKMIYCTNKVRQKYVREMITYNKKYQNEETHYWTTACCPVTKQLVCRPWDDSSDLILCDFEDTKFYIMKDYDGYLKNLFGDYMQLPPEEKRVPQLKGWYKFYQLS